MTEIAKRAGLSREWLYKLDKAKSITTESLDALSKAIGYNIYNDLAERPIAQKGLYDTGLIPFYSDRVHGGVVEAYQDESRQPDDWLRLPGVRADFAAIVEGDSMEPDYRPGQIVAFKALRDLDDLSYGEPCLVVAGDRRMLKYVRRSDDPGAIRLVSANPAYDAFDIPRYRVDRVFRVVAKVEVRGGG